MSNLDQNPTPQLGLFPERGVSYTARIAVVSGAGGGIGRAIALAYGNAGATIVAADVDFGAAQQTIQAITDAGGKPGLAAVCDVSDEASVSRLKDEVEKSVGTASVLCNVAGIFDTYARADELSLELWNRVISINLTGQFLMSRAFLPGMVSLGGGVIVNIASICGLVGGAGGTAYTASKHGVIGLTKQLAEEWGPAGVRVNAICPGVIATGMTLPHINASGGVADEATLRTPARRMGSAEEVAGLAVFLSSIPAAFIQGAAIPVDGGWTAI